MTHRICWTAQILSIFLREGRTQLLSSMPCPLRMVMFPEIRCRARGCCRWKRLARTLMDMEPSVSPAAHGTCLSMYEMYRPYGTGSVGPATP